MSLRFNMVRLFAGALAVGAVFAFSTPSAQAIDVGSMTTPDSTVEVTPANLNGWSQNGFLDWAPGDPTVRGANATFLNSAAAAPGTTNGAWQHKAVYPLSPADYSVNAYYELAYGGLAGVPVSSWTGFQYRNFQQAPGSNHAVVLFEIDQDGDLGTSDLTYIRFQPLLFAQASSTSPPAGEWNTYGVDDQATKFLDAVNAGNVGQKRFQSIAELFLPDASKVGSGSGGTVLSSSAVFSQVIIAGGLQGFPEIQEQIDYLQLTLNGETQRFDFGAAGTNDLTVVPEPASAALLALALGGLVMRRRRRA